MSTHSLPGAFERAIAAFDSYNKNDPNTDNEDGQVVQKELLYARRMSDRLSRFAPGAGESVKLAARCQHIGRWEIPREKYPMDRKGYFQWRNEEKAHHARIAEKILSECGYGNELIEKVQMLLLKKELFTNADTQLLEDVVCLVFIEFYLEDFASGHDDEKVVDILRKTFRKMSERAKMEAGKIHLSEKIRSLIDRAVFRS